MHGRYGFDSPHIIKIGGALIWNRCAPHAEGSTGLDYISQRIIGLWIYLSFMAQSIRIGTKYEVKCSVWGYSRGGGT